MSQFDRCDNSPFFTRVEKGTRTLSVRVEMGVEVRVDGPAFERIGIGDTVWVSRYTNGSYRLEA